jgi:hypothetical protein
VLYYVWKQSNNSFSTIPADFESTSSEQAGHQEYLDFFDILQMMKKNNLNTRQLDSSSVQELQNIMDSGLPQISAYARGLLVEGRFIDLKGNLLDNHHIECGKNQLVIDLKKYPNGIYMISLHVQEITLSIAKN